MEDNEGDGSSKKIKSITRAFDIIETIRDNAPTQTSDIADRFECSQSTLHYHLKTLENRGYLTRTDDGYILGLKFLNLGGHSLVSRNLYEPFNNEIAEFAVEVGESVQVTIEENGKGYYIQQISGAKLGGMSRHIGTEMYLHSTAGGKAILANLSSGKINKIIETHGLPTFTENTLIERTSLVEELGEIEDRGIAFEVEEAKAGVSGIAAPLRKKGNVVGAIELTLPTTRIPDPRYERKEERFPSELVDRLEKHSEQIEHILSGN